eukprot:m.262495 g.262495  ORF g.262495 m.262495 type:complete len:295 (-) comp25550_c0_seq1:2-886(-)
MDTELTFALRKYARYSEGRWVEFAADKLKIENNSHVILMSTKANAIFESFSLENAKKFMKAVTRKDCSLFLYKSQHGTKKFKVQFTSLLEGQKATQMLSLYFPMKTERDKDREHWQLSQANHFSQMRGNFGDSQLEIPETQDVSAMGARGILPSERDDESTQLHARPTAGDSMIVDDSAYPSASQKVLPNSQLVFGLQTQGQQRLSNPASAPKDLELRKTISEQFVSRDAWIGQAINAKSRLPRAYQANSEHPERAAMLSALPNLLMDPNFLSLVSCVEDEIERLMVTVAKPSQ